MNETMKIYVLTDNSFIWVGVKSIFENKSGIEIKRISIAEIKLLHAYNCVTQKDIFLLALNDFNNMLLALMAVNSEGSSSFILSPYDIAASPVKHLLNFEVIKELTRNNNIFEIIMNEVKRPKRITHVSLTPKEHVVLSCILGGMTVKDISKKTNVAIKTVYSHQRNALSKIGVRRASHILLTHDQYGSVQKINSEITLHI